MEDQTEQISGKGNEVISRLKEKITDFNTDINVEKWEKMAAEIVDLVKQGKSAIVYGPMRTGKTEICEFVKQFPSIDAKLISYHLFGNDFKNALSWTAGGKEDSNRDVVDLICYRAKEAKAQGKIFVLFFDEYQGAAEEVRNEYCETTEKLIGVENLAMIHALVDESTGGGVSLTERLPKLFSNPSLVKFSTVDLLK